MIVYDRYQTRKAQQKWCTLVARIAEEPLDTRTMPRKIKVFLSAPPEDGLRPARDHFSKYVKPVLVAGAMDWELVEGRREGEIRAGLAERIRKRRRRAGERTDVGAQDVQEGSPATVEDTVQEVRQQTGIHEWTGVKGDVVIGRHTWKEYVKGLHEGWLGPLQRPPQPPSPLEPAEDSATSLQSMTPDSTTPDSSKNNLSTPTAASKPSSPSSPTILKPTVNLPYIYPETYSSAPLPPTIPEMFDPSSPIPLPHVLGFMKTPVRLYRFLTRRHMADRIGRNTAAVVLASYARPYHGSASLQTSSGTYDVDSFSLQVPISPPSENPALSEGHDRRDQVEINTILVDEETDWPKTIRQRTTTTTLSNNNTKSQPVKDQTWTEGVVLDPRISHRMRRFELAPQDLVRAEELALELRQKPSLFWTNVRTRWDRFWKSSSVRDTNTIGR